MRVVIEDKLGAWVSFGKDEVKVVSSLYNMIPQDLKQDFDAVLVSACTKYHNMVTYEKLHGNKPKALYLKKLAFDDIRKWVKSKGILADESKVVVAREPRIPKDDETPRVVQKKDFFAEVNATEEEISRVFNNFDSESLSDSAVEMSEQVSVDLDSDLFDDDDALLGLEGLDDF